MPCIRWVVPVPIPIPSTAAEVRRLIAEGYSVAHVAKLTGVSRRTVGRYAWRSASRDRRPLHDPGATRWRALQEAGEIDFPDTVAAEVLRLIGEGYSTARIAKLTGVSRRA